MLVGVARVRLVGLRLLLGGPLAQVLDRQRGGDHDHLVDAAEPVGLEHHPAQPRVDRQRREPAAERRQLAPGLVERAELVQQRDAVADLAAVRRVEEREVLDVAEVERRHLQDHRGEARAQDLGVGEARALGEVLLGVEADADAVGDAPAAALALVGGGLRDRLDRQPLDLQPRAVAADPRRARGRRRSGCRARSATSRRRWWRARRGGRVCGLKTRCCSAVDRRANSGRISTSSRSRPSQRVGGVADLALAAEEDEHVARAARAAARRRRRRSRRSGRRPRPARGSGPRPGYVRPETSTIGASPKCAAKRSGSIVAEVMITFRSGRCGRIRLQVAEQEVDVQAALVRLVDDDRVVAAQQPVALDLGQQQAVGHQPHQRVLARAVVEAHRVADRLAERDLQLVGDPLGDRARGQPARLRVRDRPAHAAARARGRSSAAASSCPSPVSPATTTTWWSRIAASRSSRRAADRQLLGIGLTAGTAARRRSSRSLAPLRRRARAARDPARRPSCSRLQPLAEPVLVLQRQLGEPRPQRVAGASLGHPSQVSCCCSVRSRRSRRSMRARSGGCVAGRP